MGRITAVSGNSAYGDTLTCSPGRSSPHEAAVVCLEPSVPSSPDNYALLSNHVIRRHTIGNCMRPTETLNMTRQWDPCKGSMFCWFKQLDILNNWKSIWSSCTVILGEKSKVRDLERSKHLPLLGKLYFCSHLWPLSNLGNSSRKSISGVCRWMRKTFHGPCWAAPAYYKKITF